jgi:hypothetical protein
MTLPVAALSCDWASTFPMPDGAPAFFFFFFLGLGYFATKS